MSLFSAYYHAYTILVAVSREGHDDNEDPTRHDDEDLVLFIFKFSSSSSRNERKNQDKSIRPRSSNSCRINIVPLNLIS